MVSLRTKPAHTSLSGAQLRTLKVLAHHRRGLSVHQIASELGSRSPGGQTRALQALQRKKLVVSKRNAIKNVAEWSLTEQGVEYFESQKA